MDIVYMASSINQSNPLSAKFFIFFSEMLLALRLSDGSVLPSDSWSLPPTATASPPSALACDSLPRSGCVSVSEPCSGTGPVKIVSSVGESDASAFLRSVLLGDYPVVRADLDNESCKEEDEDNEKCENESNGRGDEDDDVDDVDNDDDDEKENAVPCSSSDNGGTLIDALSAEGGDHDYGEGRNEGAKGDGDREEDEEEEDEDMNDAASNAASNAHSSSKRGNPMSDEKNSAMDGGDTAESSSGRKMPSMKTISPDTSPRSLHSPPLKITEALRFLSVQKASSSVWSQHAGLYALMSLVHLYFTCCASEWSVREGDVAAQMCQTVQAVVEKKARHSGSSDFNDVSGREDNYIMA
jgi:hypothetical protein